MVINNFQRKGSISNTQVGKEFEDSIQSFFFSQGIFLEKNLSLEIGVNKHKKPHKYDLGNIDQKIIVECKSHTWTESGNVPSAKITTWDQAMYYFFASPDEYRKLFVVLKDFSSKRNETLCDYYLRTKQHLIPDGVEFWEYDEMSQRAVWKNKS